MRGGCRPTWRAERAEVFRCASSFPKPGSIPDQVRDRLVRDDAWRGRTRKSQMAMDAGEIERLIRAGIPDAEVTIRDLAGDGDTYAATVIAASFKGKSRVQQHQLVYQALKGEMGGKLHALALQTGTPEG